MQKFLGKKYNIVFVTLELVGNLIFFFHGGRLWDTPQNLKKIAQYNTQNMENRNANKPRI